MIRQIEIYPGKDERRTGKGFQCAELLFVLQDIDCAVTFAVLTDWLPANLSRGVIRPAVPLRPIDLTYHFPKPTFTVEQDHRDKCKYLEGPCNAIADHKYGDSLAGILLSDGSAGVWAHLERMLTDMTRINHPTRRITDNG